MLIHLKLLLLEFIWFSCSVLSSRITSNSTLEVFCWAFSLTYPAAAGSHAIIIRTKQNGQHGQNPPPPPPSRTGLVFAPTWLPYMFFGTPWRHVKTLHNQLITTLGARGFSLRGFRYRRRPSKQSIIFLSAAREKKPLVPRVTNYRKQVTKSGAEPTPRVTRHTSIQSRS